MSGTHDQAPKNVGDSEETTGPIEASSEGVSEIQEEKHISKTTNIWYVTWKFISFLALIVYSAMVLFLYDFIKFDKFDVCIPLVASLLFFGVSFLFFYFRSVQIRRVLKPLIKYKPKSKQDEYAKDLSEYSKSTYKSFNIELFTLITMFLVSVVYVINPSVMHHLVAKTIATLVPVYVASVVYVFSFESNVDLIYFKYFKEEYVKEYNEESISE
ncbi:hypothetical protein [Weissella sp. MSCH1]|uniref:hypothetical protein n=1 Tax=Weissella sp. MSCH1 TaxID=3383343 RepID=UPI003896EF92